MALPGAMLPVWGYHLSNEYSEVGNYFLANCLGVLVSVKLGDSLHARKDVRTALIWAATLASLSLLALAFAAPPVHWGWRAAALFVVGIAAGLLNSSAFQSTSALFVRDPAATVNFAGALFGFGCLITALLLSSTFYLFQETDSRLPILLALVFAGAAYFCRTRRFQTPVEHTDQTLRQVWEDVRSPGAVMFSLLLFFQSGNEWSVAGWLAIFLGHRIGADPSTTLMMLAVYYLALLLGRIVAQALLPKVGHTTLLFASSGAALFGSFILAFTPNRLGAWTGILMLGGGFAMIYPLVVEKIGHRFPNYHPGFYNGLFSIGLIGGLLAPWTLGFLASYFGIGIVMLVPFLGTGMVLLLTLAIWIETKLFSPAATARK